MRSVRTRLLSGPELRAELIRVRDFYSGLGAVEVSVVYDSGFEIHEPRIVPTTRLLVEIEKSLAAGTVQLSADVIAIEDLARRHNYRFGRDSNVSLTSADTRLAEPERSLPLTELASHLRERIASGDYRHGDDHITVSDVDGVFELKVRKTLQLWLRDRVLMEEVRALWIDRGLSPR